MMMRLSLLLALACLPACEGTSYTPPPVQLVDGNGTHPVRGMDGVLALTVAQQGEATEMDIVDIRAGEFSHDFPIVDYELVTEIQATITPEGTAPELIGATTLFRPFVFGGGIRLVMGPRSSCIALTGPRLDGARIMPGLELSEVNLIQIGGERSGDAVSSVDVFVPLLLTTDVAYDLPNLVTDGFGRTRMRRLAGTSVILVVDETHAILYDASTAASSGDRDRPITPHGGLGLGSAIADLGTRGILVVGGLSGVDRVTDATWVQSRDAQPIVEDALMYGRNGASAVALGEGVLVAGGQAEGEPLFEWISLGGTRPRVQFGETTPRTGGVLIAEGDTAFYYGGRSAEGVPLETSWVITGCARGACEAAPGPVTTRPRFGAASAERATATVVLGGEAADGPSRAVEEIAIDGTTVTITPMGELSEPRADTTAVTLGGGTVLVVGGRNAERALDSMELCFPEELDPLALE